MNIYENIVILDAGLADEEAEGVIAKIKDLVAASGGEVLKVDIWGRRKLSYEIKKQKKGLYVLLIYKTPPETIKKIEGFFKVFDPVLKYMVIKLSAQQVRVLEKSEPVPAPAEQRSDG